MMYLLRNCIATKNSGNSKNRHVGKASIYMGRGKGSAVSEKKAMTLAKTLICLFYTST